MKHHAQSSSSHSNAGGLRASQFRPGSSPYSMREIIPGSRPAGNTTVSYYEPREQKLKTNGSERGMLISHGSGGPGNDSRGSGGSKLSSAATYKSSIATGNNSSGG